MSVNYPLSIHYSIYNVSPRMRKGEKKNEK